VFTLAEPCRGLSDWLCQKARRRVPFQEMLQKQCDNCDPRAMRKCGWGRGKCGIKTSPLLLEPLEPSLGRWNKFDHLMSGAAHLKAAAFTCKRKTKVSCWNCPSLSVRTIRDLTISFVCLKRYDPKRFRNNSGNSC